MNPAGLALGTHKGVITVTAIGAIVPSVQIGAVLNLNSYPTIVSTPYGVGLSTPNSRVDVFVSSSSGSVPITATSSETWLSVTPTSATTPDTLTISVVDPAAFAGRTGSGTVTVRGPGNSLILPVSVGLHSSAVDPLELTFSAAFGSSVPITQGVGVAPTIQPVTFDSTTESGGPWLSAATTLEYGMPRFPITVNPSGLASGTYHGTITIHPTDPIGRPTDPIRVAITFIVWSNPTPTLSVTPSSLQLTALTGQGAMQSFTLSTGSLPLPFSIDYQTDDGSGWLFAQGSQAFERVPLTPALIYVSAYAGGLFPGIYHGRVIVTSPPGSGNTVTVPVTFTVTPAPALTGTPPLIASLVNAASLLPGPVSQGEIVSVFGIVGPDATAGLSITREGKVNTAIYGNRVLFNGIPAPLTYFSPTQINAVVPYEVAGSATAFVELDMSGARSAAWGVPVVASAPGLFTAILNQDKSLNTPVNPALRGSIVQIFATGEGQTMPPGITGQIAQSDIRSAVLPVAVTIGGLDAKVIHAGTAPSAIAGLFQINAQIPAGVQVGSLPVLVGIGAASSQGSATVSVR